MGSRIAQIWNWNLRHGNPQAVNLPQVSIPMQLLGFNLIIIALCKLWYSFYGAFHHGIVCSSFLHNNHGKAQDWESWKISKRNGWQRGSLVPGTLSKLHLWSQKRHKRNFAGMKYLRTLYPAFSGGRCPVPLLVQFSQGLQVVGSCNVIKFVDYVRQWMGWWTFINLKHPCMDLH